jgi:hypothetical protein
VSQARDTGPPPRRSPERPREESVRKRGLATCELRSLWDKCKQFALVGGRDICNQGEKARTSAAGQGNEDGYSRF